MANRFFSRATRPEGIEHFLATGEPPAADAPTGLDALLDETTDGE
jgi:hypothetical protein